ncbi:MAG: putative metal-binding motif-containing protein, partial [Myxococcota bacterium]
MRALACLSTVVLLACGDDDGVVDAGRDGDDGSECSVDDECSDGQFCNGPETCEAGRCVAGSPPCSSDMCDEATDMCADCEDRDGDGALDAACGGTDCDDNDRNRFPGNTEVCDVDGVDEDCEPRTFGFLDVDGDGEADAACCNMDGATQRCGTDCDDIRADVNTTSVEACDGRDNDCDGTVDEGVLTTYYRDDDGDGFGLAESTTEACEVPADFAVLPGDCDDDNGGRNPGLSERCVGMIDEDCDGTVDEMCDCVVGEPPRDCPLPGACAAGNESCESGRWGECSISPEVNAAGEPEESVCDLIDSDCDGRTDEGLQIGCFADDDRDGYALSDAAMTMACTCPLGTTNRRPVVGAIDCDDENPNANPGQTEVCNTVDADCDGSIDEGLQVTCYTDSDRDGFAPAGATVTMACACPLGTTDRRPDGADIDCNDDDASIRPGAPELCDRIDSDCSVGGAVEIGEDADNDGFARSTAACTGGFPKT